MVRIADIGAVAGVMATDGVKCCSGVENLEAAATHGTDDAVVDPPKGTDRDEQPGEEVEGALLLPRELKGYVTFVVLRDPKDRSLHSYGVRFLLDTEGAQQMLASLVRNRRRTHRRHVQSWLCGFAEEGTPCPLEETCPNIHISPEGLAQRREWKKKKTAAAESIDTSPNPSSCPSPNPSPNPSPCPSPVPTVESMTPSQCQGNAAEAPYPAAPVVAELPLLNPAHVRNVRSLMKLSRETVHSPYVGGLAGVASEAPGLAEVEMLRYRIGCTKRRVQLEVNKILHTLPLAKQATPELRAAGRIAPTRAPGPPHAHALPVRWADVDSDDDMDFDIPFY